MAMSDEKEKDRKSIMTFTKKCITSVLTILICLLFFTYVMIAIALFKGYDSMIVQSMCSLSGVLVTGIGSTVISYLCKSFFETKEEQKVKLYRDKNGLNGDFDSSIYLNEQEGEFYE